MAWTSDDLASIESAILDLATGKRVVQVDVGGKTREFQRSSLEELKSIRADMQAELGDIPLRTYAKNGGAASC